MAEATQVTMEDGTISEFVGKKKMLKDTKMDDQGRIVTRLEFLNGRVVSFIMPLELVNRFAMHGADQKFGDEIAGIADIDDAVLAVEELAERLAKGEWSMKREAGGMAGTSVLLRALMEKTGKTLETIKGFLANKTQAEKVALRNNPSVKPFIEKIEAEKAQKGSKIDTDALLGELE